MPWTKLNYPSSMKNLATGTRMKAIQIANAILKGNKKMKEGIIIATAIKQAEALTTKKKVKKVASGIPALEKKVITRKAKKVSPKSKSKAPSKTKSTIATKSNSIKRKDSAKTKSSLNAKTKPRIVKKAASATVKKAGVIDKKSLASSSGKNNRNASLKPLTTPDPNNKERDGFRQEAAPITKAVHGENLHITSEMGDGIPITTFESNQLQNALRKRQQVELHQENQKVSQAMASRKNNKRTYRHKGGR